MKSTPRKAFVLVWDATALSYAAYGFRTLGVTHTGSYIVQFNTRDPYDGLYAQADSIEVLLRTVNNSKNEHADLLVLGTGDLQVVGMWLQRIPGPSLATAIRHKLSSKLHAIARWFERLEDAAS